MFDHERFQMHCRFCFKVQEGDSIEEAMQKVEEHENECPKKPQLQKSL